MFREHTKQIIAHANVPKYLKSGYDQAMARRAKQDPAPTTPAPTEPTIPDRTFTDVWSFDHGDERVTAKHYGPAHTGGDAVIRFERANVISAGNLDRPLGQPRFILQSRPSVSPSRIAESSILDRYS